MGREVCVRGLMRGVKGVTTRLGVIDYRPFWTEKEKPVTDSPILSAIAMGSVQILKSTAAVSLRLGKLMTATEATPVNPTEMSIFGVATLHDPVHPSS